MNGNFGKLSFLAILAMQHQPLQADSSQRGLPLIGDSVASLTLGEAANSDMILLRDSVDENLFYIPYDRLALTSEDGILNFGFAYSVSGALMNFVVQPSYDQKAFARIRDTIRADHPNARFVPLPITEGSYSLSIKTYDGETIVQPGQSITQAALGNPWATSISVKKEIADSIVVALQTGAVLGVNFRYQFKAATFPSAVRVVFHRDRVIQAMNGATLQTQPSMLRKMKDLEGQRVVQITSIGADAPLDYALVFLSRWFLDQCFAPIGDSTLGNGYRFDSQVCNERLPGDITITNSSTTTVTATAGMSIGGLCNEFPEYFAFEGPRNEIKYGCPDRVLPDSKSELNTQSAPGVLHYELDDRIPAFPSPIFE